MTYVGVDLHKYKFMVCYRTISGQEKFHEYDFAPDGLLAFQKSLTCFDDVAVESIGCTSFFVRRIRPFVRSIMPIAPSKFPLIAKSFRKTDKNDARIIAKCLEKGILPRARIRDESCQQVLSVMHTRQLLTRHRRALLGRLHAILFRNGIALERTYLRSAVKRRRLKPQNFQAGERIAAQVLLDQLDELEKQIDKLTVVGNALARQLPGYDSLMSISGFGKVTGPIILAHIGNIDDFETPENLSSYFGVVPIVRESGGIRKPGRITKEGDKLARASLILSAMVAAKYSPYLRDFRIRIKKRRGSGRARVAVARKLLTIVYHTLSERRVYDDFTENEFHIARS